MRINWLTAFCVAFLIASGSVQAQEVTAGGRATSVSNSDGTLTISPTTGAVVVSIANPVILPITITPTQAANTSVPGLNFTNSTAASAGNQRFSPALVFTGQGWGTTAPGSQETDWRVDNEPVQGASAPTAQLVFSEQVNGAGYTPFVYFNHLNSVIYANGPITASGSTLGGFDVQLTGSDLQLRSGGTFITSPSNTILQLGNSDAAAPIAQTLSFQSVVAGTTNTAGVNATMRGSLSTGSGTSGDLIFQTGGTGAAATVQNSLLTALTLKGATQNVLLGTTLQYSTIYSAAGTALPTCNTAAKGMFAVVSDATTPAYHTTYTSGGAVISPEFCNGTNWLND